MRGGVQPVIPEAAVEAALNARLTFKNKRGMDNAANLMRHILEAAAPHLMASGLREAAEEFDARLPDGTGNGRAYNSYTVASILRERADGFGAAR